MVRIWEVTEAWGGKEERQNNGSVIHGKGEDRGEGEKGCDIIGLR